MNTCSYCDVPTTNPKFCSRSCSATVKHQRNPFVRKKQLFFCVVCKQEIGSRRKYCKKHIPGTVDWSKVTLADIRSRTLYQAHSQIRIHSRATYKKSNKPKFCVACGYDKHYDVCHIKDIWRYKDSAPISEINGLENLLALCKCCHWEFDRGLLTVEGIVKEGLCDSVGCLNCGGKCDRAAIRCKKCHSKHITEPMNNIFQGSETWPPLIELVLKTCGSSFTAMGRKLGKSDNAVKKRIKTALERLAKEKTEPAPMLPGAGS